MNETEFYRSVGSLADPARLKARRVAVIGLGSGGSRVAAELARLGVQLLLVDRPGELLEEHNLIRHVLGYGSLGKSKLTEMAAHLRERNPSVEVDFREIDVVEQQELFASSMRDWHADSLAVCTDNEASKHAVNRVAVELGLPQTGGAVYDGGIGGEVYRTRPGGACYGCIASELQLPRGPARAASRDYSNPEAPEAPSTCALNLDIGQIALLQSRIIIEALLEGRGPPSGIPPQANLLVFANRVVPGTFVRPFHCEFFCVAQKPDCLECGAAPQEVDARAGLILSQLASPSSAEA